MTAQATAPAPERALVTTAADPEVAAAMQLYDRLDPLKAALGVADLSVPELQLFAMVAHRTGLDPFTRQIYAIKRSGKVTHQTGIDGYRSVAERTHQYLGSDEPTYEECPCGKTPAGHPAVARVVVHRAHESGHVVHQTGVARWHELVPPSGQDQMWQKMPFNQLSKCAEANGLRKAFPRVLGGVYIAEELEQAGPGENGALVAAASQPTARDRLRARREAIAGDIVDPAAAAAQPDPTDDQDGDVIEGVVVELTDPPAATGAPEPLSSEAFLEFLREWAGRHNADEAFATALARRLSGDLFPGTTKLDDEQRARLAVRMDEED